MAQLAVAAVMGIAGVYKGVQARKTKNREADAYVDASDRRQAAMTRDVSDERRKARLRESRLRAVAGKAGAGGIGTSGITSIMGDLNAESEYNVLAAMFTGLDDAKALQFRADAARAEGEAAFAAGVINGVVSAVSAYQGIGGLGKFKQSEQMKRGLDAAKAGKKTSGVMLPAVTPSRVLPI